MNSMRRSLCLGLIYYFCCLSMIVYGNKKTSPFYLAELKCENLIDPLGIDNVTPHFSWKLKGDGWKGGQTYYGEFYQFNLSSCIRQQNSLTAQFVSFSLSNLANIFYPPQFLQ